MFIDGEHLMDLEGEEIAKPTVRIADNPARSSGVCHILPHRNVLTSQLSGRCPR
jgi:hypothetical protein